MNKNVCGLLFNLLYCANNSLFVEHVSRIGQK